MQGRGIIVLPGSSGENAVAVAGSGYGVGCQGVGAQKKENDHEDTADDSRSRSIPYASSATPHLESSQTSNPGDKHAKNDAFKAITNNSFLYIS